MYEIFEKGIWSMKEKRFGRYNFRIKKKKIKEVQKEQFE